MITLRFVHRNEWEAELRHYACFPLEGQGNLNTAEWWRMPWQTYPFTVPVESDGRILQTDLDRLVLMIVAAAPDGTEFPPD